MLETTFVIRKSCRRQMNFSDVFLVDKHIPISSVNGKKVAE